MSVLVLSAAIAAPPSARPEPRKPITFSRTINDGIFTPQQSLRGEAIYGKNCAKSCHLNDLAGNGQAPVLAGESFLNRWRGLSVADLFYQIENSMPKNSPHSLTNQEYVDIIAYLLDANGLPSGDQELAADPKQFSDIGM